MSARGNMTDRCGGRQTDCDHDGLFICDPDSKGPNPHFHRLTLKFFVALAFVIGIVFAGIGAFKNLLAMGYAIGRDWGAFSDALVREAILLSFIGAAVFILRWLCRGPRRA